MKNIPEKIYLQVHGDAWDENMTDFNELVGVTWCKDRINDDDLEYVYQPKKQKTSKILKNETNYK